eukprot:187399_1
MSMSFDLEFHGRTSNASLKQWEQMFRLGWPALTPIASESRFPSLWLDNMDDVFHFSLSHSNNRLWSRDFNSFSLVPHQTYSVHIEWNETWVYFKADSDVLWNSARDYPTNPDHLGRLLNIYIASDSVPNWDPYIIANVTLRNIVIQTTPPTQSPTLSTAIPTTSPSTNPTNNPTSTPTSTPTTPSSTPTNNPTTANPTSNPSSTPTTHPSSNPSSTPSSNPSSTPSSAPIGTSNPSSTPTSDPSTLPSSTPTSNPSTTPSSTPTGTSNPSSPPTSDPSTLPSSTPTSNPSTTPSSTPTGTSTPSSTPTSNPSTTPSANPSSDPTSTPIVTDSTSDPTSAPITTQPSLDPVVTPSTTNPSNTPTANPSAQQSTESIIATQQTETQQENQSAGNISNELIYLIASAVGGCVLCTVMIVLIIRSRNTQPPPQVLPADSNKKNDGDQSPYVEFPDKSPSVIPDVPPPNEESMTPVIIAAVSTQEDEVKATEGTERASPSEDHRYHALNEDEMAEIRDGRDDELSGEEEEMNHEETHNVRDHETEYEDDGTSQHSHDDYGPQMRYQGSADEDALSSEDEEDVEPGIDGMDPYETAPQQPQPQPPHIMVKRKYLMSEQLEEEYIKRMMNEVAVVDHGHVRHESLNNDIHDMAGPSLIPMRRGVSAYSSSQKPPPKHENHSLRIIHDNSNQNTENRHVELVSIIDDNDSVVSDNDTLKNVPHIPAPAPAPSTLLDVASSHQMDEESITMLESGYEWITLVLLEIDSEHWREYVDNFKQHGVTEERLADLAEEDLRVLIPHIGPRNEFEKLLENKLGKYHD